MILLSESRFLPGRERPINPSVYPACGTTRATRHADWLGTERVRTSAPYGSNNWSVCESIASLPFGDGQTATGACYHDSTLHFTGKERDAESGLDNFGARYNSSSFGRFLSPDWSASPAPVPYASLPYPQSLNLYSYVQNNPLKSTDPTGHCTVDGENHWGWCIWHSLGFYETKKETAAREAEAAKRQAEFDEYRRSEIKAGRPDPVLAMSAFFSMYGGAMGAFGGQPEEPEPAGVPRTMVNGVPQPAAEGEIVVAPDGTAIRIPAGYVAEAARNGNGIIYRPAGSTGDANIIEIMGPDKMNPNGYAKVYNSIGQPIDPSTMKQGTTRAAQHIQFGKQP